MFKMRLMLVLLTVGVPGRANQSHGPEYQSMVEEKSRGHNLSSPQSSLRHVAGMRRQFAIVFFNILLHFTVEHEIHKNGPLNTHISILR